MSTSAPPGTPSPAPVSHPPREPRAVTVSFTADALHLVLVDGREVFAPLTWFPRLLNATPPQRANHRLIGQGVGIHWPDLDEDISVRALLAAE